VNDLAKSIGSDCEKGLGEMYLECMDCGKITEMKQGDFGEYLGSSWPKCCGYTMRLQRKPLPEGE